MFLNAVIDDDTIFGAMNEDQKRALYVWTVTDLGSLNSELGPLFQSTLTGQDEASGQLLDSLREITRQRALAILGDPKA